MTDSMRPVARVPKRLRFEILRRDNHTCRYCGSKAPDVLLTIDHVVPVVLGGSNDATNLVTACKDCNAGKSSVSPDTPLVNDVSADALRWARAADIARHGRRVDRALVDEFQKAWGAWRVANTDKQIPLDAAWRSSVNAWIERGLELEDLIEAIPLAMKGSKVAMDQRWRYFCGIAWNLVEQHNEQTSRIVQQEMREQGISRWLPEGYVYE